MCGINGIIYPAASGRSVDADTLVRMRDVLRHRGPDEEGLFVRNNVGLGHRRLSIVDLKTGQQPMFNEDRSAVIVYNGEVYNHMDLRPDLAERGIRFHTTSDTETILKAYEAYGPDCVHKFRGMFAFAIWDDKKQELFIARDRLGVKPLYYYLADDGSFYFGSEIKAIIQAGALKPALNYAALPDYLANHGTTDDQTLFAGIKRLLPGHTLTWKDGKIGIEQYWDLAFEPKLNGSRRTDADWIEEWLDLFRESVRLRLMSDVPLGMFLSGGIDSSAIAAVMSQMVDEPIKTFSVGFKEREANEFEYARLVAERYKTDHHEITITPEQFFTELPNLVWHEDEPLGFEASVPLYFVSKLAQEHVKVVLTGEGSDETLGGYGRYRKAMMLLDYGEKYEAYTPKMLRGAVRSGVAALPATLNKKLKRTFLALDADIENIYFDNFAIFGKTMQTRLFSEETKTRISEKNPYFRLQNWLRETDAQNILDTLLYADTKTYLHELLMKQDQMSMAASIESRVPFLDHNLVEFAARLPEKMKIRGSETKWILRRAMKGLLPPEILNRPKMGFPVPMGNWLKGEFRHLVDEYVLSERSLSRGIYDAEYVRRLATAHNAGEDHASRLFRLMNIEIWHRIFIDGEG
ncbi:MAG: asparagine synthase (glutamine-hydrolyzing) [Acidobacteria bacterium]|nr:asparagine synthase (glutamine-hydrolyzing) [Acidobacteriota bacterium]